MISTLCYLTSQVLISYSQGNIFQHINPSEAKVCINSAIWDNNTFLPRRYTASLLIYPIYLSRNMGGGVESSVNTRAHAGLSSPGVNALLPRNWVDDEPERSSHHYLRTLQKRWVLTWMIHPIMFRLMLLWYIYIYVRIGWGRSQHFELGTRPEDLYGSYSICVG